MQIINPNASMNSRVKLVFNLERLVLRGCFFVARGLVFRGRTGLPVRLATGLVLRAGFLRRNKFIVLP
jgi:hypothetical protein